MDYLTHLEADYRRLAEVSAGLSAEPVPTCPEWTVDDLLRHVALVYLHKTQAMRQGVQPRPWPPDVSGEPAPALLARAYEALTAEFATRAPSSPAYTFYGPDQTVGFWLRRMAHETVIHRIDAELAGIAARAPQRAGGIADEEGVAADARGPRDPQHAAADSYPASSGSLPIPAELAVDGIDELLQVFVAWASRERPEQFAEILAAGPGSVSVSVVLTNWLVSWGPDGITVEPKANQPTAAAITGSPDAVMRWLWRRADTGVTITGDESQVAQMRQILAAATQ